MKNYYAVADVTHAYKFLCSRDVPDQNNKMYRDNLEVFCLFFG